MQKKTITTNNKHHHMFLKNYGVNVVECESNTCKNRKSGRIRKKKIDNRHQSFHTLFIKEWGTQARQAEIVQWVISTLFVYIATLLCVHFAVAIMNMGLAGLKYTQIGSLRKICRQRVWVAERVGGIFQAFELGWCWENGPELESCSLSKRL